MGSEMCIRDRGGPELLPLVGLQTPHANAKGSRCARERERRANATASATVRRECVANDRLELLLNVSMRLERELLQATMRGAGASGASALGWKPLGPTGLTERFQAAVARGDFCFSVPAD